MGAIHLTRKQALRNTPLVLKEIDLAVLHLVVEQSLHIETLIFLSKKNSNICECNIYNFPSIDLNKTSYHIYGMFLSSIVYIAVYLNSTQM